MIKPLAFALPRPGVRAVLLLACVALAFCNNARKPPAGQCDFNSDCDGNLICAGRFCRAQCQVAAGADPNRDCVSMFGAGWRCLQSDQPGKTVCLPPGETAFCVYHSDCTPPEVCNRDGRCGVQCHTDRDCVAVSLDTGATCQTGGICSFRDAGTAGDGAAGDGAALPDAGATE